VCGNGLKIPIDRIDDAVLGTLAGDVLRPAVVMAIVDGVFASLEPRAVARDVERQRMALQAVDRGLGNLAKAIAAGGQLEPLLVELQVRQVRRAELLTAIATYEGVDVRRLDRKTIEQKIRRHINGWRALLSTNSVQEGRQLLREVLTGRLRFTPEGRTYRFEGLRGPRSDGCWLGRPVLQLTW